MMAPDGALPAVDAGSYPPELAAACRLWQVRPGQLLAWSVRSDGVTLVLPGGQKVSAGLRGEWAEPEPANPPGRVEKKK